MTEFLTYQPVPVSSASNPLNTRGALLAVCAMMWAVIVLFYAQGAWLSIVMLLLTDGLMALLLVAAATALGDVLFRLMKTVATGPLRVATAAGLGLGVFSLTTLALGMAGLLNQVSAIALPVISFVIWFATVGRTQVDLKGDVSGHLRDWLRKPAGGHWLFVAAIPALAIATVGASMMPGFLWKPDDPHPYDVVSYHLQVPREWYEIGRIVPLTHNAFSYFPFNVEMHFLLSMHIRGGPWAGMYLAQFMSFSFGVLAIVAVYGMARTIATRAGATIAAVAIATMPWTVMLSSVAYVEMALVFYAALAVGWMVLAVFPATADDVPIAQCTIWRNAVLAGLCGGLACGVKLTAGPMLLGPLALAGVVVSIRGRQPMRKTIAAVAVFVVVGLIVVSPWLVRNAVWTGNPFFPNATSVFGTAHWLPAQVERYTVAHSPGMTKGIGGALAAPLQQIVFHWQYGFVLIPLAVLGVVLMGRWNRIAIAMVLVLATQLVFWCNTHMIGRFMLVGVPMVALLVALVDRRRVSRIVASILIVVAAVIAWIGMPATEGGLHSRLDHFAAIGRQGVFGMQDVSFLQPLELKEILANGGIVHFVGDAQTFLQMVNTAQTRYRTVFDVRPDSDDPIVAWTGKPLSELGENEWVLIDPAEISRLSKTYRHVPDVPASYPGPRDRPYLMNSTGRVIVPAR